MILNSIGKTAILSIRRRDLIINLFIVNISIFTLCNLVNNDLDNALGGSEKEPPLVYDENLQITQLTEELNFPTGIDFLAEMIF